MPTELESKKPMLERIQRAARFGRQELERRLQEDEMTEAERADIERRIELIGMFLRGDLDGSR